MLDNIPFDFYFVLAHTNTPTRARVCVCGDMKALYKIATYTTSFGQQTHTFRRIQNQSRQSDGDGGNGGDDDSVAVRMGLAAHLFSPKIISSASHHHLLINMNSWPRRRSALAAGCLSLTLAATTPSCRTFSACECVLVYQLAIFRTVPRCRIAPSPTQSPPPPPPPLLASNLCTWFFGPGTRSVPMLW